MNACKHPLMLMGNMYDFQGKCRPFLLPLHPILLGRVGGEKPIGILLEPVVLVGTIFFAEEISYTFLQTKLHLVFHTEG